MDRVWDPNEMYVIDSLTYDGVVRSGAAAQT